jgi:CheY-like chemotaxis protein
LETTINAKTFGQVSETILLVDDDETALTLGQEMLSKIGYTILTAADGERALEIYHQKQNIIDLIILDLMMPGMGGLKCLEKLVAADPHVKILIASGHPPNRSAQDFLEAGAKGFITKPYGLDRIVRAIQEVLG